MTVQPNLKSTAITNLDASPPSRGTAGKGATGNVKSIEGTTAALTTGNTAGGILRMVRIPSNAIVKRVSWAVDASTTTFDADVGLYYSDDVRDGTTLANVAAANTAIDADMFGSAVDMHTAAVGWTDCTFEALSGFLPSEVNKELWDAAGLTSDPGGYFDVSLTNTSTTSGAPVPTLRVEYVMPS